MKKFGVERVDLHACVEKKVCLMLKRRDDRKLQSRDMSKLPALAICAEGPEHARGSSGRALTAAL